MNEIKLMSNTAVQSMAGRVALREQLFGFNELNESGDWDLARAYAYGGRSMLSESANRRGRRLMESIFSGFSNLMNSLGQKVSRGWGRAKELGVDAKEMAGKVLTAMFDEIPMGKAFFDMIKSFSKDALDAVKDAVGEKVEEIKETLLGLKDEIIEKLLSKDVMTPDLIKVFKEAALKAGDEIKTWFQELINTPANAVKSLLADRGSIASFAAKMFKYVLNKSETAKKAVVSLFLRTEMFSGKAAMLTMGIIKLAAGKLDDTENIVGAASDIWNGSLRAAGKNNRLDIRHYGRDIIDFAPKAVEGMLSGENPVEVLFRAIGGDPTKLVKHALKLGVQALKKLGEKGVEAAMKKVGVQEDTKVWSAVKSASLAMLGAVTKGIGESRMHRNGPQMGRAMVMS